MSTDEQIKSLKRQILKSLEKQIRWELFKFLEYQYSRFGTFLRIKGDTRGIDLYISITDKMKLETHLCFKEKDGEFGNFIQQFSFAYDPEKNELLPLSRPVIDEIHRQISWAKNRIDNVPYFGDFERKCNEVISQMEKSIPKNEYKAYFEHNAIFGIDFF